MSAVERVRHQVAIAGRITDAQTGRAIAGAEVRLTAVPPALTTPGLLASLHTAADGHFHYLDLPDGSYTLSISLPEAGSRYGTAWQQVAVSRTVQGKINLATADIPLPPTTIKGQITNPGNAPIVMAEIRVRGSGEKTFSDGQGRYVLSGLEAGARTILVSAQGFQTATETSPPGVAGSVSTLNFTLTPSPS
ncbi:hypothetical protein MYXO_03226 [Myxococcaceae bacterium]|nr:hypothetical protein MYXO_03226 [Myxococcaceae bacterium]